ncbi:MAG: hypothetical protein C4523_11295 [Myxococcales bacterium]|nr:MAG: hypothetical protein C4523_11295 [Myxococcales bacterium]
MKTAYKNLAIGAALLVSAALFASCASTKPYIANESQAALDLQSTPYHEFRYVRLYPEEGQLILYGKVDHRHGLCGAEPHVDLAIIGPDNAVSRQASLAIANRGGKRYGWRGASFRVRLPEVPAKGENIRLTFHETGCSAGENFDCGGNAAAVPQETTDGRKPERNSSVPYMFPGSWR